MRGVDQTGVVGVHARIRVLVGERWGEYMSELSRATRLLSASGLSDAARGWGMHGMQKSS